MRLNEIKRIIAYASSRLLSLFITSVIAVYLTIVIANMGGYVDEMMKGGIEEGIGIMLGSGWLRDEPLEERARLIEETRQAMYEARGLNKPFLLRTFLWLKDGITLDFGEARLMSTSRYGLDSRLVKDIILDNLPRTLLLFTTSNIFLFLISISIALTLSRQYGTWLDKFFVVISPLSSAPPWFYGIFLIVFFAFQLRILPSGGMFGTDPSAAQRYGYALIVLRHMILPVGAIFLSSFFQSVYSWRTFFLIYAEDDYVEMARARGLPKNKIERNYLLRPALPNLLTSFSLLLISSWSGSMLLELVFRWPGMGFAFFTAVQAFDTPVIVGFTVIYAYMLALTVFILDVVYVLVDPRVKLNIDSQSKNATIQTTTFKKRTRLFPRFKLSTLSNIKFNPHHIFKNRQTALQQIWLSTSNFFRELVKYPSAISGIIIILVLVTSAIYISMNTSYEQSIRIWRSQDYDWTEYPRLAPPAWTNWFRREKLPTTLTISEGNQEAVETSISESGEMLVKQSLFTFDYPFTGGFPQDVVITIESQHKSNPSFVSLTFINPDGEETYLASFSVTQKTSYYVSQDKTLQRKLKSLYPQQVLFSDTSTHTLKPLTGQYQIRVDIVQFEKDANTGAKVILHGQVYGWAGTDMRRRDLSLALMWGLPIALAFGLLAVIITSFTTMLIAAIGAWFGGWVDALIQRLTEINMVIPLLPVLAMVAAFYSRSIWLILGATILFNIFGSAIKNYRSIFVQFREQSYIDAARSYGASDWRIIFKYLVPRIFPVLIPQIVVLVPGYVFLETSLALMGLGDPSVPTWGKLLRDAYDSNALIQGHYYWVLEPLALLLITGFGFALLGFALDRILNPRLRDI